jgi:small subunit ribosomal protein S6
MRLYENVFICRQDLSQQQVDALLDSLGLFVTQNSGDVVRSEYCGFRNLAYPIKKNHNGHYSVMQLKADAATIAELGRIMTLNEDIIRHLVVRVDVLDNRENLIPQARTFGDDFGAGSKSRSYDSREDAEEDVSSRQLIAENNATGDDESSAAEVASGV